MASRLDYLQLSAPSASWWQLQGLTDYVEPGWLRGFRSAEVRSTLGGRVLRGMEPHQASSSWGTEYEHWQWSGATLLPSAVETLRGVERSRASRVDVAFDLYGVELSPRELRSVVRRWDPRRKLTLMESDDGDTLYIGAPGADRRIRIYAKGLRWLVENGYDPAAVSLPDEWWRVELQLRAEPAAAMWAAWVDDPASATLQAAGHVLQMSGLSVGEVIEPAAIAAPVPEVTETLFALVDQHASTIAAALGVGVDLLALCEERVAMAESRTTRWRHAKRLQAMQAEGPVAVAQGVRKLLARGAHCGVLEPA